MITLPIPSTSVTSTLIKRPRNYPLGATLRITPVRINTMLSSMIVLCQNLCQNLRKIQRLHPPEQVWACRSNIFQSRFLMMPACKHSPREGKVAWRPHGKVVTRQRHEQRVRSFFIRVRTICGCDSNVTPARGLAAEPIPANAVAMLLKKKCDLSHQKVKEGNVKNLGFLYISLYIALCGGALVEMWCWRETAPLLTKCKDL